MSGKKVLEVNKVSKSFLLKGNSANHLKVLSEISFSLNEGESLGIIGKNGSGKSTLLKLISGIIKPDHGMISIWGKVSSILDLGFGMIPELTGRENIDLWCRLEGKATRGRTKLLIDEIVDFAELWDFIDQPVKNYSNGMYLRLAFAAKTIIQPDLLIIDEIMTIGDVMFQEKCKTKINELKTAGASLIFVSHSMSEIVETCADCLLLANGQIEKSGSARSVVDFYLDTNEQHPVEFSCLADGLSYDMLLNEIKVEHILSPASPKIYYSDSFNISMKLEKGGQTPACNVIIYVYDYKGLVMSDSVVYRKQSSFIPAGKGDFNIKIYFPPFLFNRGTYTVSIEIAERNTVLIQAQNCCKFIVSTDEWEKDEPWNSGGHFYPFRPRLDWVAQKVIET